MNVEAVFFDVDGTLIGLLDKRIPESTQESLKELRNKQIKVFVCTGRHHSALSYIKEKTNFSFDGYIFMNGQYITDENGKCLYSLPFDETTKQELYAFFKKHKRIPVSIFNEEELFASTKLKLGIKREIKPLETMLDTTVYQVSPYSGRRIDKVLTSEIKGCKSARWHPTFADIIPIDGGKNIGVEKACELFNVNVNNTMAFGDGENDIDMLKRCKIGVAMAKANKKVKAASDYITSDVMEDGVLKALQHFGVL